jgi:hypothetical protein
VAASIAESHNQTTDEPEAKADEKLDTNTPAGDEHSAGDDSAAPDKGDDDKTSTNAADAWRADDEVKALVSAYGITDDELAQFSNRDELDRAMTFLDRAALKAGHATAEETTPKETPNKEVAKPRTPDGKFAPSPKDEGETQDSEFFISETDYDEGVAKPFNSFIKHATARIAALEETIAASAATLEQERFDSRVDSLDHPELFGVTGKETDEQLKNRKTLFMEEEAYLLGLGKQGRKVSKSQSMTQRVARMVFSEHLTKQEIKQRTTRLSKQSNMRMGGSSTTPVERSPSVMDKMQAYYDELERS